MAVLVKIPAQLRPAAGGAAEVIRIEDGMLTGGGDPRPGTSSVIGY